MSDVLVPLTDGVILFTLTALAIACVFAWAELRSLLNFLFGDE